MTYVRLAGACTCGYLGIALAGFGGSHCVMLCETDTTTKEQIKGTEGGGGSRSELRSLIFAPVRPRRRWPRAPSRCRRRVPSA